MTEAEASHALKVILRNLGIRSGDLIYLGVDMGRLPLPDYPAELDRTSIAEREQRWCAFILQTVSNFLGPQGTILVPTFTYSCSRPGSKFVVEETPSEIGPFTEYFRRHTDAFRSNHPLFSVAGIGPLARPILAHVGKAAFGSSSMFGNLNRYPSKFLCLGVPLQWCLTYIHHLEQTYGCNHRYNKVFRTEVVRDGKIVPGPWLAYVAFRSIKPMVKIQALEQRLRDDGALREEPYLGHPNQCIGIEDLNRVGYAMLGADTCSFMSANVEVVLDETEGMKEPISDDRAVFLMSPVANG